MEFVQWFFIAVLVLEIPAALGAYVNIKMYPYLDFLWCWKIYQAVPIGGGIYVGLVAYFT